MAAVMFLAAVTAGLVGTLDLAGARAAASVGRTQLQRPNPEQGVFRIPPVSTLRGLPRNSRLVVPIVFVARGQGDTLSAITAMDMAADMDTLTIHI